MRNAFIFKCTYFILPSVPTERETFYPPFSTNHVSLGKTIQFRFIRQFADAKLVAPINMAKAFHRNAFAITY
jgi:hypothetical protein